MRRLGLVAAGLVAVGLLPVPPGPLEVVPGYLPATLLLGFPQDLQVRVRNDGAEPVGRFDVIVLLSPDEQITAADLPIGRRTVAGLAAGEEDGRPVTALVPPGTPPGPYFLGTLVDGVAAPLGPVEVVAPDALELALPREASFRPRVLVVSYNPFLPNAGVRLDQYFGWNDALELAQGIRRAVLEGSGGFVNYQIVDFVERDEFPLHASGFRYTEETYLAETAMDPQWPSGTPTDFPELHRENRIHERVEAGEIDEAWIFGGPGFGYAESWMAGRGAFTINGPIFENDLSRAVPLLGLNYERGVGCALESLGHRIEATLARAHGSWTLGKVDGNAWERFTLYDLVAPGQAAVGTVHFAPNSVEDYDWANPRRVPSTADDWLRYPDLTGATREVGPEEWAFGAGDCGEAHHRWWLAHLPHAPGQGGDRDDGKENNWWKYIVDVAGYAETTGPNARRVRIHSPAGPVSGPAPFTVEFDQDISPGLTRQVWSFSDGTPDESPAGDVASGPVHTFERPGVYAVSLSAIDDRGSPTLASILYVTVTEPPAAPPAEAPASRAPDRGGCGLLGLEALIAWGLLALSGRAEAKR